MLISSILCGQHIDRNFIANFIKTVRSETDKTLMFAVGEFWKDSIDDLAMYIDALGTQVRNIATYMSAAILVLADF